MRRRLLQHLAIWAAWSIPAAFVLALSLGERELASAPELAAEFLPWYYWAFLTLPIARHAQRHSLETLRTLRGALRHLAVALAIGAGCGMVATLALIAADGDTVGRTPAQLFVSAIIFWCVFGLIFYTMITAVGFAIATQTRLRERELASAQLEARLVEAQLNGLRMQLEPHFLFNTLNTVAMYVRDGDAATSIRILTRLSELLRRVLDTGAAQEVPLGLELEHVQRYVEIETLRFADRLRVEFDVAPELHQALVPNLALQPLVENAIRHGIAKRGAPGLLRIAARRTEASLVVSVYNDGPALAADWNDESAAGIGVRNTRMRLQHLYDGGSALRLVNAEQGVLCEMVLPYHV